MNDSDGWVVQGKDETGWKKLTGMSSAVTVQIKAAGEGAVNVEIGNGKWIDKLGAGAAGMVLFAPLALTAAFGAWKQKSLPKEILARIDAHIMAQGSDAPNFGSEEGADAAMANAKSNANVICPSCGATLPSNKKFCPECGTPLTKPSRQPADEVAATAAKKTGTASEIAQPPKCPNCGASVLPGKKFCIECGTRLDNGNASSASGKTTPPRVSMPEDLKALISKGFSGTSLFGDMKQLTAFTKEFAEKIILPANSVNNSTIWAHPFIEESKLKKLTKQFKSFDSSSTVLLTSEDVDNHYWALTTSHLYFAKNSLMNPKEPSCYEIPVSEISALEVGTKDDKYTILCNGVEILAHGKENFKDDATALTEYFRCLKEKDFVISDEEVDKLIQEKIGADIYAQVKKHMVYDDELMLFFAWGLDSLTAKDYIVCTNNQIIIMDRELFGMTANVKQFYYEDITSMQTVQNSNDSSLFGFLVDSVLTSMFKQCDLEITVTGTKHTISTLNKSEAERVIAIFHEFRKKARKAATTPQVIVQQSAQPDIIGQLEKLAALKNAGVLTEEEFNAKKADLLSKL